MAKNWSCRNYAYCVLYGYRDGMRPKNNSVRATLESIKLARCNQLSIFNWRETTSPTSYNIRPHRRAHAMPFILEFSSLVSRGGCIRLGLDCIRLCGQGGGPHSELVSKLMQCSSLLRQGGAEDASLLRASKSAGHSRHEYHLLLHGGLMLGGDLVFTLDLPTFCGALLTCLPP